MKRNNLRLIMASVLLLVAATAAEAQFEFATNADGTLTITNYTGPPYVTIPATTNGRTVTAIGDSAFMISDYVTDVIIPNTVTSIGAEAFGDCESLTNISIPGSVTNIGVYAFATCETLSNLTIPNGVISIGDFAFYGCNSLRDVTIPVSVTNIGAAPFGGCLVDGAINVDPANPAYSSVGGVLFDKNQTTLVELPAFWQGAYTVPNSVTNIREWAFEFCYYLNNVVIGNNVSYIGVYAFGSCEHLTNITMGYSVSYIDGYAFSDCVGLSAIYFTGNAPGANTPSPGGNVMPTAYYLPGTTGWAAFTASSDIPTVPWALPNPVVLHASPGIQSNQFSFTISWATNASVVVEACTNLANPTWEPVATNLLSGGVAYFSDAQWTNYPARFYRLSGP